VIHFLQRMVIYRSAVDSLMRTINAVALGIEPTSQPGRGTADQPTSRLGQFIGAAQGHELRRL